MLDVTFLVLCGVNEVFILEHVEEIRELLVQILILAQRQFEKLIEVFKNDLV
jgi:hypothetical protein